MSNNFMRWRKAKIIEIEGIDGCGKETQSKMLYEYLISKGYKTLLYHFPNYENNQSSYHVTEYLNGRLITDNNPYAIATIFAMDRYLTFMSDAHLIEAMLTYDYIIFDRYTLSNVIYQSIDKNILDMNIDIGKWIYEYEHNILNLPKADKIIYISGDIDVIYNNKREKDDTLENNYKYQDAVMMYALSILNDLKIKYKYVLCTVLESVEEEPKWRSKEDIHKDILNELDIV